MTATRHPAVAGRFYPNDPTTLLASLNSYLSPRKEVTSAIACMVPHAGYIYSGQVAGSVYATLAIPRRCIILCPNHTGVGHPLSIVSQGTWRTPLDDATIDSDLANTLKRRFPLLIEDSDAHAREHAIEVELPFLQVCRQDFTFVPIALGTQKFEVLQSLGEVIGNVIAAQDESILIIASSDMNHYESDRITREKDHKAIDRILALDPQGLFEVAKSEEISMCGLGSAVTMLTAAKHLGASKAELLQYATSGDVSGDREMVVGYAGVVVK
ncbi:MAG TPA: AmmeMemoRadiSam system protein B [Terriglobales bacterium]|nr:AmmeMemoRadiSam system protein B [Terriglobales bacterium]